MVIEVINGSLFRLADSCVYVAVILRLSHLVVYRRVDQIKRQNSIAFFLVIRWVGDALEIHLTAPAIAPTVQFARW